MSGWTNSSAAASGTGGWRFTSHSTNGGGNNRWRERGGGRGRPHYRYRPVNSISNSNSSANAHPSSPPPPPPPPHHHLSGPAMDHQGQGASSTSARRSQPLADDKSPIPASSATMRPADVSMQPDDKASRNATNFECNVCFDLAADPVVTKCGHLFCWECLYQWLHVHSHHRECPVCKGQVTDDAIIPIYGRGGSAASVHTAPPRPTGARVESYRQQPLEAVPTDDDEDPFDLQEFRVGFGVSSLRDAMITSFMPSYEVDMEQHDDDFADLLGSHGFVGDYLMESLFNSNISTPRHQPQPAVGYPGTSHHHQNHGRHGRRQRPRARAAAASADHSRMAMGGSGAFYHDTGGGPNVTSTGGGGGGGGGASSGGRSERRGRSNRNPGRGMQQDSRRQRTNYN